MSTQRIMAKEIGTALAVLAIYLLTILAPLHQARASQLALQELGFTTLVTGWVLCSPLENSSDSNELAVAKCPATSIGKNDLIAPPPAAIVLPIGRTALAAPRAIPSLLLPARTAPIPLGARAPPVLG
ncbi:hypothetical protein [Devosia submarina]|uniref:hypothetical protein n=1 Tax=Devosia submarina TaxID=1173082 RepID=UPI000D3AFCDF|nr:hypothetical protein [Devosia submarina]